MCLILFATDVHPNFPLVLAANRDEFHARPTAPLHPWPDLPILAGRDLRSNGTWLGVRPPDRWAALTNVRTASQPAASVRFRGLLVSDFLQSSDTPRSFAHHLVDEAEKYDGFNLLMASGSELWWVSNRGDHGAQRVTAGVHGLSNASLDTPWPKVERGKRTLSNLLRSPALPVDSLLDLLLDRVVAEDHELPGTGLSMEMERAASAMFITTPDYGTRCSTVLLLDHSGRGLIAERQFDPAGNATGTTLEKF